jgi:betaine-aldehyde dehydrogenase
MNANPAAKHWIDGEWLESGARRASLSPATGEVIGSFHDGGVSDAQACVAAAQRIFREDTWKVDGMRRATVLSRLADAYENRAADLIECLAAENGKLKREAGFEVGQIPRALRFAAGLALQTFGRVLEPRPGVQSMALRQAIGVVGIIVPWNSPAYLLIRALAPALAAGCTAVIKLPPQAAQTGQLSSEILASVLDLPKGAVNIFVESGSDGAKYLVDAPDVPAISFTGSTATGREIAASGARHLKRIGLELGGKTPHLVFADADLDSALPAIVASSTVFAGQFCITGSRILVDRRISETLKKRLAPMLEAVRLGPASDAASEMGPLIDKHAVDRVDSLVEAAIAAGAKVIVRGGPVRQGPLAKGAFYRPTLLEVSSSDLQIVRNEIFGPVQTLQVFDTEQQAIVMANDSDYGLSACVWSQNADRPIRVARQLEAGHVCINDWANLQVEFEEGGFKSSGRGRLGGVASLDDFLEYKQVCQVFHRS